MPPDRHPVVLRRVAAFLADGAGLPPGSQVLVGVSGGPDSTALAAALGELAAGYGLRVTLGHIRHGLRSERDEACDEAAAHALASHLGVDVRVRAVTLAAAGNVEARARVARRRALRALAAEAGATHVALGHTLDDQAETLLLRLLRGGGRGGIAAMRPYDGRIVRPLLGATRADVTRYLSERQLAATRDRSNADLRFARNRVRRVLLPLLAAEFNPRIAINLAALATRLRDEDDVLEAEVARHAAALLDGERLACALTALPAALGRRLVRSWLLQRGIRTFSARHVERVLETARPSSRAVVALPGPWRVLREGHHLVCRRGRDAEPRRAFRETALPGTTVHGGAWRLELSAPRPWGRDESPLRGGDAAVLDAEALPGPLAVRSVRPGDRVQVLGVGTRKLHDVLVDRKIPREHRATLPVLVADDVVVWVPGVIRAAVARVEDGTRHVLEARLVSDDKLALPLTKSCGTLPGRSERA